WESWRVERGGRGSARKAQTRFIASTRIDANPQFSPDGERVAFTSSRSGQPEIWVADSRGGHALRLTLLGKDGTMGSPRWSPDAKSIAFDFAPIGEANVDVY